jgi:hypothetical protein
MRVFHGLLYAAKTGDATGNPGWRHRVGRKRPRFVLLARPPVSICCL